MQPTAAPKSSFPGPLDYTSSAALMNDYVFRGRVQVACLKFAAYISGEAPTEPAHNTRYQWAQNAMRNPDPVAQQVQRIVVGDPAVQSAGDTIDDSGLQGATEVAINKLM